MTSPVHRRRITLLVTGDDAPERHWDAASTRFIDLKNLAILEHALHSLEQFDCDVERAVIDHAATSEQALHFLSVVPTGFVGDILFLRPGDSYLSAATRGEGRMLRRIAPADIEFYLSAHHLTAPADEARAPQRPASSKGQESEKRPGVRS
jgi:hypothetical protein